MLEHNFNLLDLQYTDLQQVDVLPGITIYGWLAKKTSDV